jgi:hypothetical protein
MQLIYSLRVSAWLDKLSTSSPHAAGFRLGAYCRTARFLWIDVSNDQAKFGS